MIEKKNLLIGGAILVGLYLLNPFSSSHKLDDRSFTDGSTHLAINNFVGRLKLTNSTDGKLHINIENISSDFNPNVDHIADKLEINGKSKIRSSSCNGFSLFSWNVFNGDNKHNPQISINGGSSQALSAYPILTVQAPESLKLVINNSIVQGQVGNVKTLDVQSISCTTLVFGDVADDANIALKGSGEIKINDIGGAAYISIRGSGDVSINSVAQDSDTQIRGSGDVEFKQLNGINRMKIQGSGNIDVGSINGDAELLIQGSGDIDINDGDLNWLIATIQGSGDIDYDGKAKNTRFTSKGSGEISTRYNKN